jgi:outer membrane receptor protein involved in Fe transport
MRYTLTLVALLPLGASAGDAVTEPAKASVTPGEEVVVTATREPRDSLATPASVSRIDGEALAELSAKHQSEALNQSAAVYIQRGSGAQSLTAIRSPVLAGAGACGAFLVAEDNIPIRPVGFCNLNEMFELNYEQAGAIEVLRGPGSAMYGASAVHGIVNLLTPRVADLADFSAGIEGGSDSFKRLRLGFGHELGGWGVGAYGVGTDAPGWRDSSPTAPSIRASSPARPWPWRIRAGLWCRATAALWCTTAPSFGACCPMAHSTARSRR